MVSQPSSCTTKWNRNNVYRKKIYRIIHVDSDGRIETLNKINNANWKHLFLPLTCLYFSLPNDSTRMYFEINISNVEEWELLNISYKKHIFDICKLEDIFVYILAWYSLRFISLCVVFRFGSVCARLIFM